MAELFWEAELESTSQCPESSSSSLWALYHSLYWAVEMFTASGPEETSLFLRSTASISRMSFEFCSTIFCMSGSLFKASTQRRMSTTPPTFTISRTATTPPQVIVTFSLLVELMFRKKAHRSNGREFNSLLINYLWSESGPFDSLFLRAFTMAFLAPHEAIIAAPIPVAI